MKRALPFLLLVLFAFAGCKKETPTVEVTYSISERSAATPAYNIEYTSDQSGGTTVTSYNTASYSSGRITLKQGQFISMKVTCSDPTYELFCTIFVNGNTWKTGTLNSPSGSLTLSGNLPAN